MTKTRRQFLQHVGALGIGGFGLQSNNLFARFAARTTAPAALPDGLVLETVRTDGLAHLSYLIGDGRSRKAAVIDPRRDVNIYLEMARQHGLSITHILETHIHADFVSGARELAGRAGLARICLSAEGGARYGFAHQELRNGARIELGGVTLTAQHTPGHTPEHLAYVAAERSRLEQPWGYFSGDFLFAGSVGRPDLLGQQHTDKLAKQLFQSVQAARKGLPDAARLFPAHGAGSPCGANICDRQSTVGDERRDNPAFQFSDEAKFIDWVLNTAPPIPYYYPRMKKINAHGPEILKGQPAIEALTAAQFRKAVAKGDAQLLDNRHMLAFGGGHIAGALNIGPKPDLSLWSGWMLDPNKPILLVLTRDADLAEVQRQLIRVGYSRFAGYLKGGMNAWISAGLPLRALPEIPVHTLKDTLTAGGVQLVDVRTPTEWQGGHIPGARYIFLPEIARKSKTLDRDKPVAVYCASGYRSSIASSVLQAQGFAKVYNVPGSWKAWTAAGYPVEKPKEYKKASDTDR